MANGKVNDWIVGVAKWGYTPQFSEELEKGLQNQQIKVEFEKLSGEFAGMGIKDIDKELFRQSQQALDVLNRSNNQLRKVSVTQEKSDPVGITRELQAQVEENKRKYDEIERKREVVRQMEDVQFWEDRDDPEKLAFYNKMHQHSATINKAAAESAEIGGVDVSLTFENAKLHAQAGDWQRGSEWLDQAIRKAEAVNLRKPYLTVKLAHEPKIKAACKVKKVNETTNKKYGDEVDAQWKEILKRAEKGEFGEAAGQILELVRRIDTEINLALKQAREDNAKQLGELKEQLERAKGNPELLREKAKEIFRNTSEAEDLGIDPGENARKPFTEEQGSVWTASNCEETFVAYDWFALKKCRKEQRIKLAGTERRFSDDDMWKLVQYRGKVVNEAIDKLRKIYPTLIASASGSEDIESDIDIAFATPRSGDDVKAAMQFNKVIMGRFGKPPGRVFDVNIYPRDYRALRGDSFKPGYNVDEIKDHGIDEPDNDSASMKLSKIDQDVATLLKQRRFLDEDKFNDMLQTVLNEAVQNVKEPIPPVSKEEADKHHPNIDCEKKHPNMGHEAWRQQERIQKQYEEGEDTYLLTSLEKVDKIRQKVNLGSALNNDERAEKHRIQLAKHIEDLDRIKNLGGKENLAQAQRLIPKILDMFEEVYPDESMDVTDALYLEKMGMLREDQETIRTLKEGGTPDKHHPDQPCEVVHKDKGHADWLNEKLNGLEVAVKKNMFTNIIFANEAIMSQGALNHVVGALQAKTPQAREEELGKLTASDLMQSVNEQVADLFKEMKHYDGVVEEAEENATEATEKESARRRATGEGYVHASKYFFRLLDAAILLNLKYPQEESVQAPYDAVKNTVGTDLVRLKKQVDDVLLKLRKSAVIPPEVKGEVGALEMQEIFPQVTDIPSFRKMIEDFAIELNRRIRSLEEFKKSQEMDTEEERKAEQAYFKTAGT